jgi:ABC-2 type transport system ATP-binding protein
VNTNEANIPAIRLTGVTKRFNGTTALQDVSLELEAGKIYGLLGRNGAGKTTLLSLLTTLRFPTSGTIQIFGEDPVENEAILSRMVLIREQGQFPEDLKVRQILQAASVFYPRFDMDYAQHLAELFELEPKRRFKKLSRGMQSAVGIVVGLAARADITLMDEPSLGLDVVARQQFYDLLLEDYTEHPRTIVFSTHLIDEVSKLFESVIFLEKGQITRMEDSEDLRTRALYLSGKETKLEPWLEGREVLHRESFGSTLVAAVYDGYTHEEQEALRRAGIEVSGIPLQKLFIYLSRKALTERKGVNGQEEVTGV